MKTRILIADDDALVREGLRVLLEIDGDFEVVDCVENGKLAVERCSRGDVDVALLDVRMPVMDGLTAASRISEAGAVRVLILTTFDDDELVVGAIRSGARGYLLKNATPEQIREGIRLVRDGGTVMQDVALDKIRARLTETRAAGGRHPEFQENRFSARELDVVRAIAQGLSNREIAERLFVSEGTVKNHITSILGKTGLDHRTQIAIYYLTGQTPP